jgi:SOS-response transcriptional repressor LexA
MTHFGARLRELRTTRGLSQQALADRAGVSQAAIVHWEAGNRTPGLEPAGRLAAALGVSLTELVAEPESPIPAAEPAPEPPPGTPVRLLGVVGAGPGRDEPAYDMTVRVPGPVPAGAVAYLVAGDSMTAAGVNDGDVILVRPAQSFEDGERVVAWIHEEDGGGCVLKRAKTRDRRLWLESLSHDKWRHPPRRVGPRDVVYGVLVRVVPAATDAADR